MKKLAICVAMGILFQGSVLAQTINASLGGTVTDSTGALIPGASVTIKNVDTGLALSTTPWISRC